MSETSKASKEFADDLSLRSKLPAGAPYDPYPDSKKITAPDIGIWGPPYAGKTMLLRAALSTLQTMAYNNEDGITVGYEVKEAVDAGDKVEEHAKEFLASMRRYSDGILPEPNRIGGEFDAKPFSLYITYDDEGDGLTGRFYRVAMTDAAGENCRQESSKSDEARAYWKQMKLASGMLIIISLDSRDTNWATLINLMRQELGDNIRRQAIAICVTKIDKVDKKEVSTSLVGPPARDYLKKHLDKDAFNQLTKNLREGNWEVFLTSATGWRATDNAPFEPHNVALPLIWLLDKIETQRFNKARKWYFRVLIAPITFLNRLSGQVERKKIAKAQDFITKITNFLENTYWRSRKTNNDLYHLVRPPEN